MKKHKHIFKYIGGGCYMSSDVKEPVCDDHYKCNCGAEFKVYSNLEVHFKMPKIIKGK